MYRLVVVLKGGQFVNVNFQDKDAIDKAVAILEDMIRRIFNSEEKDTRFPFCNFTRPEDLSKAWVDAREMSGFYIIPPTTEDTIMVELQKRQLDIQERFLKLMEKEHKSGDEWKGE